jgi:hypothetical protein
MNNLSWSKESTSKKAADKEEPAKQKKKISYKKEIEDLEKIKSRLKEKYESLAINRVSNAILEVETAIHNLKKLEYYDV